MRVFDKQIGLGTTSLLLSIMGILFGFSFGDKGCYGDIILRFIGLNPWSNGYNGVHYTIFYSLIFFIPALIIGYKYKNHLGAKIDKIISLIMIILILVLSPLFMAIK